MKKYIIALIFCAFSFQSAAIKYVLALDPGAMLGFVQALLLEGLESNTKKPIGGLFDLIGGTSTGAVIASLLASKDDQGLPKFTAGDVRKMYETMGVELFSKQQAFIGQSYFDRFGFSIEESEFTDHEKQQIHADLTRIGVNVHDEILFKEMLEAKLGKETKLADLQPPVAINALYRRGDLKSFITQKLSGQYNHPTIKSIGRLASLAAKQLEGSYSYDDLMKKHWERMIQLGLDIDAQTGLSPIIFRSDVAKLDPKMNISAVDAVMASSALYTLFLPHQLDYNGSSITCIDGDCDHLSTVWETVKVAKEMWPNEKLVVFTLGCIAKPLDEIYIEELLLDRKNIESVFVMKPGIYYQDVEPSAESTAKSQQGPSKAEDPAPESPYSLPNRMKAMRASAAKFMEDQQFDKAVQYLLQRPNS